MKKLFVLAISALLLTGCGTNASGGSVSQNDGSKQAQTTAVTPGTSQGSQKQFSNRVTLPEKVKFVSTMTGLTTNYESYKIGNKVMLVDRDSLVYAEFNPATGLFETYFGSLEGGVAYWNNTKIDDIKTLADVYSQANQEFIVEYDDNNSFLYKYMKNSKTSEKKEILGVECTKYYDETSKFEYWIDEDTMLVYESNISGFVYQITEKTSNFDTFPYATPNA